MKIIEGFKAAKAALTRQGSNKGMFEAGDREQAVREIIDDVCRRGDAALFDCTEKFDGVRLAALEVMKEQIEDAYRDVDSELVSALKLAAERVGSFHAAQKDAIWGGVSQPDLSQLIRPLKRAGVYVPGDVECHRSIGVGIRYLHFGFVA